MAQAIVQYITNLKNFNRNIKLYLLATFLINLGFGAFQTDFNLYILSMGMTPDFLGIILSLAPFAEALASIPIGFLAEKIGFKRSLIMVYLVLGLAYSIQIVSPNKILIMAGSFMVGLVACGNFIIQLPFITHYTDGDRNQAFTFTTLMYYFSFAMGGLLGGFLPRVVNVFIQNETLTFRILLGCFILLVVVGSIPAYFLNEDKPESTKKISLSPYLNNMDKTTVKFAVIELFIGGSLAFLASFMNIIFVYYFKTGLEFYGLVSAILLIPTILLLFLGPMIAEKISGLRAVLISRFLITIFALFVVSTQNPYLGAGSYILFRSIMGFSQSLWFAFAISVATRRSRMATSTWLEITFQIGMGIAALVGGNLIAHGSYLMLGIISSVSMGISFLLTYFFFGREHLKPLRNRSAEKKFAVDKTIS